MKKGNAAVVGIKENNYNYLKVRGWMRALTAAGWDCMYLSYMESLRDGLERYDLILYDGAMSASLLRQIRREQIVILIGGAGDNLEHYRAYADKISLITSSFFYYDNPPASIRPILNDLYLRMLRPDRLADRIRRYFRYRKWANPNTWESYGIRFMYLPLAADTEVFYPIRTRKQYRWVFCGTVHNRKVIPALIRASKKRGWHFRIGAPDRGTGIDPLELNELYARATCCPNECGKNIFRRELNIRTFELGMAGKRQVTDLEWLARPLLGDFARYYGTVAEAIQLIEEYDDSDPDTIHDFFKEKHSFTARLKQIDAVLGTNIA